VQWTSGAISGSALASRTGGTRGSRLSPRRAGVHGGGRRDKNYDTKDFVAGCRELGVTPHVAQNTSGRRSAIDGRTATQPGYAVSQRIRKRVEEIFGWLKTVAGGRKLRHISVRRNQLWAEFAVTAYNLVRIRNLVAETCAVTSPASARYAARCYSWRRPPRRSRRSTRS
jgi:hypothetical protein